MWGKSKNKKGKSPKKEVEETTQYGKFLEENRKPWMWFNLCTTLGSIGLAIGTYFILDSSLRECSAADLKITLWLVFAMHIVNAIETLLNFTGLERRLCVGPIMCVFFIFEVTILVYMQVIYF